MEKNFSDSEDIFEIVKKIQSGEKISCNKCHDGVFVAPEYCKDLSHCNCFRCNNCGCMIHVNNVSIDMSDF